MLGPKGNPSLKNISFLLESLKKSEGIRLRVQALR